MNCSHHSGLCKSLVVLSELQELLDIFYQGLAVGVFAAPCIGPPIIALLAFVGSQGDPIFGFFTLSIMSLGLGIPYLILGTFSGLLNKLPKSGTWMSWVKKVFGVILIGIGVFYLGLALFPSYATHTFPGVLIAGGIYLALTQQVKNNLFRYVKWTIGAASVIVGLLFINNLQQEGITWGKYTPEKLQAAQSNGKPVMLDFYASWCVPCLELERVTFTNSKVIDAASNFRKLKIDLTRYGSPRSKKLREKFDVKGVPTVIFIDQNGKEVKAARTVGFLPPKAFLKKINLVNP